MGVAIRVHWIWTRYLSNVRQRYYCILTAWFEGCSIRYVHCSLFSHFLHKVIVAFRSDLRGKFMKFVQGCTFENDVPESNVRYLNVPELGSCYNSAPNFSYLTTWKQLHYSWRRRASHLSEESQIKFLLPETTHFTRCVNHVHSTKINLMFMGQYIVIMLWHIIPTRCTCHRVYLIWQLLYMIRASILPIFRGTKQL
jgi:hypothetical protein